MADSNEALQIPQGVRQILKDSYDQSQKETTSDPRAQTESPRLSNAQLLSTEQLRALEDMYSKAKEYLKSVPRLEGGDERWSRLVARGLVAAHPGGQIKYKHTEASEKIWRSLVSSFRLLRESRRCAAVVDRQVKL